MEPRPRREVPDSLIWLVAIAWRVAFLLVAAGAVVLALARVRVIVLPVVVALLLATVLAPPAQWLRRRGVPALAATWLVFLAAGVVLGVIVAYIVPTVAGELDDVASAVDDSVEQVQAWLTDGPLELSEDQVDRWVERAEDELRANRGRIVSGVLSGAVLFFELVAGALLTLVLTFFFVKDGPRMVSWALAQVHGQARDDLREVGRRVWDTLGGYVRGSTLDGAVEAALKAIGLLVLGVPLVLPLAVLTFFGGYLPFAGAIASGLVAAAVALVAEGPVTALLVVALSVVIQNVEGDLLQPLIMGKVVKLHPVVILVSITTALAIGGLVGAFLAVPTVASAANVAGYFRNDRSLPDAQPGRGE